MATVSELIKQLNDQYHWTLPTVDDFPPGSMLREVWSLEALPPDPSSNSVVAVTGIYPLAASLSGRFILSVVPEELARRVPPPKQGAS